MYCQYCNKEFKFQCRVKNHETSCRFNTSKPIKKHGNQYTKAAELGLPKPKVKQHIWTEEEKKIQSVRSKIVNQKYWSDNLHRQKHSALMHEIVKNNPDSYSSSNVSGRVKMYEVMSSTGLTKVKGKWELRIANWLNENNIKWTNNIEPYKYFWNNSWHLYFPDFLLLNNDTIIEVKGYETDRDKAKWKSVIDRKFLIIKEHEMKILEKVLKQAAGW